MGWLVLSLTVDAIVMKLIMTDLMKSFQPSQDQCVKHFAFW